METPATPVRPCTPLSDAISSDIAPSEVELPNIELDHPESPLNWIWMRQSGWSKSARKYKWYGNGKQGSLNPEGSPEDGHTTKLAMLDMELTRPSDATTDHGRQRLTVIFKSIKIWPTRMSHESIQPMLTELRIK